MPTLYAHTIYIVWTTCHIWCGRLSSTPYSSPHYIFKGSVSTPYVTCCPHYIQMFSTPYTHTIYYPVWNRHPHTISKNPPHYIMWICSPYKFNGVDNMNIWCGRHPKSYGVGDMVWTTKKIYGVDNIDVVHTIYDKLSTLYILFSTGYTHTIYYILWSTTLRVVWRYTVDYFNI